MRRTARYPFPRLFPPLALLVLVSGCAEPPSVAATGSAPCRMTFYHSPAADGGIPIREAGCADRRNLAAMLANPEDLLTPRGSGLFDGRPAAAAIARYRADATVPLMMTPDLPIISQPGASPAGNGGAAPAGQGTPAAASPGGPGS